MPNNLDLASRKYNVLPAVKVTISVNETVIHKIYEGGNGMMSMKNEIFPTPNHIKAHL